MTKDQFEHFLRKFTENLRAMSLENKTVSKISAAIESSNFSEEDKKLYRRALKIAIITGEVQR
jgi:hypothetical protein